MNAHLHISIKPLSLLILGLLASVNVEADPITAFDWQTVVNNNVTFPGETRNFNSYNQPSVNDAGLVVFRGRSQGGQPGGEPATGILTRDMSSAGNPLNVIATRTTVAPLPAYATQGGYTYTPTGATFNEFPAIPRIDQGSSTIATRGQTPPVLTITDSNDVQTKTGTSAIYTNPGGTLISGVSNFGNQPGFDRYLAPGQPAGTKFDQFPGAPSVTDGSKIVFKGNFAGGTGVYWTDTADANSPIYRIADTTTPGTDFFGGSTAPPSAANGQAVFLGVDNEDNPTKGGIYLSYLTSSPTFAQIVGIGEEAPGSSVLGPDNTFSRLGEALSFDGRYMAFWSGVGSAMTELILPCPADGNKSVLAYCMNGPDSIAPGDPGDANDSFNNYKVEVPTNQGIYLYDLLDQSLDLVASTWGSDGFTDFLYWGFTGRPPGVGGGDEPTPEEGLELARWRSTSFLAVDNGMVAFKGSKGDRFGLYLSTGSGDPLSTIAEIGDPGDLIDPDAAGMDITALGIERDGFRNGWLAISASMANDEESMAGVYIARVPEPGTLALLGFGMLAIPMARRRRTVA